MTVEQSKNLKVRLVYLTPETAQALREYLAVRAPTAQDKLDYVFVYRHKALSSGYCQVRLQTYARQ